MSSGKEGDRTIAVTDNRDRPVTDRAAILARTARSANRPVNRRTRAVRAREYKTCSKGRKHDFKAYATTRRSPVQYIKHVDGHRPYRSWSTSGAPRFRDTVAFYDTSARSHTRLRARTRIHKRRGLDNRARVSQYDYY